MRPDPIGLDAGINLYTYCLNHPVNFYDPTGEAFISGSVAVLTLLAMDIIYWYTVYPPFQQFVNGAILGMVNAYEGVDIQTPLCPDPEAAYAGMIGNLLIEALTKGIVYTGQKTSEGLQKLRKRSNERLYDIYRSVDYINRNPGYLFRLFGAP